MTNGSRIGYKWVGMFLALALLGEAADLLSGRWGARRFGGSKAAAWGALLGGLLGMPAGQAIVPVPLIGAIVGSFVGTFAGAICGEMHSHRKLAPNLPIGIAAIIAPPIRL